MASEPIVTKSNMLIEASYKLSLNEQRLILCAISQIDSRKPLFPKDKKLTVTAADFSERFNIPMKQAYEALENAADRMYERELRADDVKHKTRVRFRWVSSVKYWDGEAKVTLGFSDEVVPMLTRLHQKFTSYELRQVAMLNTAHAIRFYELLIQFKNTGFRVMTLEKFRDLLDLQDKYPLFYDLRRRVIDPAVAEINQTTNLNVTWETTKKGNAVNGLKFTFQEKQQGNLEL